MGKLALTKKQIKIITKLRQRGHSLPEIQRFTGHGKGTIFKYIQGVQILPEFFEYWKSRRRSSTYRMMEETKRAETEARAIIQDSNRINRVLIASCLYWAEGTKKDFSLSNTDPELIKVFIQCLGEFGVKKKDLRVTIRVYEDLDIPLAIKYWAHVVGIPKGRISNVNVLKGKKKGKLKYGMCRIRVIKGGYLLKIIRSIINLTPELAGPYSSTDRIGHS